MKVATGKVVVMQGIFFSTANLVSVQFLAHSCPLLHLILVPFFSKLDENGFVTLSSYEKAVEMLRVLMKSSE